MEIREFEMKELYGKNVLLMGNRQYKRQTVENILCARKNDLSAPAFIVFDVDGSLYEKYGKGEILADWNSVEGCFPDYLTPIVKSPEFGGSLEKTVNALLLAFDRPKSAGGNNEQFWSGSATKTVSQYCEYILWLLKNNCKIKRPDCPNLLIETGSYGKPMKELMNELVYSTPANRRAIISKYPVLKPLLGYVAGKSGNNAMPFDNTLNGPGNTCGTQMSIMLSADVQGALLFKLMSAMADDRDFLLQSARFGINKYIATPHGRIMFVCGTGNPELDAGLAAIASLAVIAASETEHKQAVMLFPASEKWRMTEPISRLSANNWKYASFVYGFADENAACKEFDARTPNVPAKLVGASDMTIWFGDKNKDVRELFRELTGSCGRVYEVSDLNGQIFAVSDRQGEVNYYFMDDPQASMSADWTAKRTRRERSSADRLWFYTESGAPVKDRYLDDYDILRLMELGYLRKEYNDDELVSAMFKFCSDHIDVAVEDMAENEADKARAALTAYKDTKRHVSGDWAVSMHGMSLDWLRCMTQQTLNSEELAVSKPRKWRKL